MKPWCVIGRGMIGSVFSTIGSFALSSHKEWDTIESNQEMALADPEYGGYVCAAGVAGTEQCEKHSMDSIMEANVGLPRRMLRIARMANVPLVVFSTTSIYAYRGGSRLETDEVHPHNRYIASKIAMEYVLQSDISQMDMYDKCYILRIPWLMIEEGEHSFGHKCKNWTICEDIDTPVIYPCDIARALRPYRRRHYKRRHLQSSVRVRTSAILPKREIRLGGQCG